MTVTVKNIYRGSEHEYVSKMSEVMTDSTRRTSPAPTRNNPLSCEKKSCNIYDQGTRETSWSRVLDCSVRQLMGSLSSDRILHRNSA